MKPIKKLPAVAGKIALSFIIVIALIVGFSIVAAIVHIDARLVLEAQPIFFLAAIVSMYAWFERGRGWSLGFNRRLSGLLAVHGMIAGIVLITASSLLIWFSGGITWKWGAWDAELARALLKGIAIYMLVAVGEEAYMRGYVQGLLRHHYGSRTAIIASSLLFALIHSMNPDMYQSPFPFINITAIGILFAIARELTGSLWLPIGLHLTWNLFQGNVFGYSVSGTDRVPSVLQAAPSGSATINGGAFGAEGSVLTTAIILIGIVGIYYLYRGNGANQWHASIKR